MKLSVRRSLYVLGLGVLVAGGVASRLGLFAPGAAKASACSFAKYSVSGVSNDNGMYTILDVVVPSGCTKVKLKAWGDGGNTYFTIGGLPNIAATGNGGAGGFVLSEMNVTPGQTLRLLAGGNDFSHASGGKVSYVYNLDLSSIVLLAPGGGGGAGAPAGYTQLGSGGAAGGYIQGRKGGDGIRGGQVAGGGWGGAYSAGGGGGTGVTPGQNGGSNFSFTAGFKGYWFGGDGGFGYGSGGGGGSAGSGYPNYVSDVGGGGGGGTAYTDVALRDLVVHVAAPGAGRVPSGLADPDYISGIGYGALGGTSIAYPNHAGGSGRVVAIFGQDLTVSESQYPPGWTSSNYCGLGYNTPTSTSFRIPPAMPAGCTSRNMNCRAAFDDAGSGNDDFVCRYACTDEESVYVWRSVCPN